MRLGMKFFIDTANATEIADLASGPVGGDTTNCSLVANTGRNGRADWARTGWPILGSDAKFGAAAE